jgi:hypothetical protein
MEMYIPGPEMKQTAVKKVGHGKKRKYSGLDGGPEHPPTVAKVEASILTEMAFEREETTSRIDGNTNEPSPSQPGTSLFFYFLMDLLCMF